MGAGLFRRLVFGLQFTFSSFDGECAGALEYYSDNVFSARAARRAGGVMKEMREVLIIYMLSVAYRYGKNKQFFFLYLI
jgi:hypothetical protein